MRKLKIHRLVLFICIFLFFGCPNDDTVEEDCSVNVANSKITVTADVSGEEGTQITPDVINTSTITSNSAEVAFVVHKVGRCHEIIDYGHVWSKHHATPTKENASQTNYGSDVNFGDEVVSLMRDLEFNSRYYVRGYVTIRSLNEGIEKTLYNDKVSTFQTLSECVEGSINMYNDRDRKTLFSNYSGSDILSFEILKERYEMCVNGGLTRDYSEDNANFLIVKNLTSNTISCSYKITYALLNQDGSVFSDWTYVGNLSNLAPNATTEKLYLNRVYGNIKFGVIDISLTNVIIQ